MSALTFTNQTAIVTGAGSGLGRLYALALAQRGASVAVNDRNLNAAQTVAYEIRTAGGQAIADGSSVTEAAAMAALVARATQTFGHVDILICNAGVTRDKSFAKSDLQDFRDLLDIHVMGAVNLIHAAWPQMLAQGYGRVVLTASGSGLYGNFGQSNYSAAKLALVGLMNSLNLEGGPKGVHVNTIVPTAATAMTAGLLPPAAQTALAPAHVVPAMLCLSHTTAPNGVILAAGAGWYRQVAIGEYPGLHLDAPTPENLNQNWQQTAQGALRFHTDVIAQTATLLADKVTHPGNS